MKGNEIVEEDRVVGLPALPHFCIGIAIEGNRKSKYAVDWALQKFIPEGNVVFKLLHVHPKITKVPTPMGNHISISQVREDVAAAYKKEMEWQRVQMLLPYKQMCTKKKVQADIVLAESDDVANAIAEEVAKSNIKKLVIGASSRGMFKRNKGNSLSSRISVGTPSFCTVYAVSKGKLSSIRPSDSETNGSIRDDSSMCSESSNTTSTCTSSSQTDGSSITSFCHLHSPPLAVQRFQALSSINRGLIHSSTSKHESNDSISQFSDFEEGSYSGSFPSGSESGNAMSLSSSLRSLSTDTQSWVSDQPSGSNELVPYSSSENQEDVNLELEKLRIELRHVQGIYAMAQNERVDASRKLIDLNKHRLEEAIRLKEISEKEKKAKELASQEKERSEAAISEAEYLRDLAEREASRKRAAALTAEREAKEKEKLEIALLGSGQQYHIFPWEEIVSVTSSFSEDLEIGMGAYGTVYKCSLHHTLAAVKVLHSKEDQNTKQFQKELDILSKVRHQHLLILLGACPDHGCLVYEYMENGSLQDRLQRVNNTPPIPWFDRFRIAWEVASALVFLHNTKPKPIIHRDLKPANILLDSNFVSKIGDVGLSTVLDSATYKDTGPVGTLCYIDPEYQRTGLISAKSDLYAFGIVILQLLTAKEAIGLAHIMETAIDEGRLSEVLDLEAGDWPPKETKELAMLGLKCAELRCKERPDLRDQVLPVLERLKETADRKRHRISAEHLAPPDHFLCPILKDVMDEPCAAADGYTYDRRAIEKWFEENDTSPMTNLLLPNKNLLPNYTLLSVIMEWKSTNE